MTQAAPAIRVLLTEDVAADAELEVRELRRAGLRVESLVVETEAAFRAALKDFAPDVILSDFSMPGFDGMAALAMARELTPSTPFVFVSGTIGEEYAIRALRSGATDYVLKTNLVRLPAAVERALAEARERRERSRTEAELEQARARLTSVLESMPDMLWSVDARSDRLVFASPAARLLFGRNAEEFLADPWLWLQVVHREDQGRVNAAWEAARRGEPFDIEYRALHADGSVRWIHDRGRQVSDGAGVAQRIDGVARDITESVAHRGRIARLSRIRELVGDLNAAIVRIRNRQELFEAFCGIAVERGGFQAARLVELHEGKLTIAVDTDGTSGTLGKVVEDYNARPGAARSLLGEALRTRRAAVSNDLSGDRRALLRQRYVAIGVSSLACLPYFVEQSVAGAIVLTAKEANFFDDEEMRLLAELTGNLGFALELMEKQDRITHLALYDALTGLPNRSLFHERLAQGMDFARANGAALALALVDVERFKAINDTYGQRTGDWVLQQLAQRLQHIAGDIHRVARVGSNTFALVFQDIGGAEDVARRIEQKAELVVGEPLEFEGREVRLAAKSGIAVYPADGADADSLLRNAEAALKRAKETGERYLFYAPDINARVAEQVELENRLRKAVERGELFLHYQPKVDLVTRRMVGLEALMRWTGPDGVFISPARFVPVLEQTGLILEAGRQALAAASARFRAWNARGLAAPRIAVNVSALQLRRRAFVSEVQAALGNPGLDGGGVDLEITESLLMTEVVESIRKLRELRDMGLRIALDDFGTGYSSLSYLSKLPVDALKIDRGFIHAMTDNVDDTSIISTVISLAQSLRLKVVAEGVETQEQAQLLRLLRCDQAQGYLFGPPMPPERVEALLEPLQA